MAQGTEFFAYRETIMKALSKDQLLIRALANPGEDALTQPDPDLDLLLYNQIFPYKRNDQIIETSTKNFLFFELAANGVDGTGVYANIGLTFYILVHNKMDRIKNGDQTVLRMDYISHRLAVLFKQQRNFGIGKLSLQAVRPLACPVDFAGEIVFYSTVDFS